MARGARALFTACVGALALSAGGCATTGLAWVHERESGVDLTPPEPPTESVSRPPDPPTTPAPNASLAPDSNTPIERPAHRLDHTITLGGSTESSVRSYDAPPAADPRGVTIVNVYVNQPYPNSSYYSSYGYGAPFVVAPRMTTVRTQAPAALRPGLDWPAVPNHGPAFPYRTGPASPWDGADPRRR